MSTITTSLCSTMLAGGAVLRLPLRGVTPSVPVLLIAHRDLTNWQFEYHVYPSIDDKVAMWKFTGDNVSMLPHSGDCCYAINQWFAGTVGYLKAALMYLDLLHCLLSIPNQMLLKIDFVTTGWCPEVTTVRLQILPWWWNMVYTNPWSVLCNQTFKLHSILKYHFKCRDDKSRFRDVLA